MTQEPAYDPKKLQLGDLVVFRKTIRLEAPEPGDTVLAETQHIPQFQDVGYDKYITSASHIVIDREDPNLIHLVGVVSVVPDTVLAWQEAQNEEARIRAMEQALDLEEGDI